MSDINLASMVKDPSKKWIHFLIEDGIAQRVEENEKHTFAVLISYKSPREYREMLSAAIERKVASTGGAKAVIASGEEARQIACRGTVLDWKMTFAAAAAIDLAIDMAKCKADDPITFTTQNLRVMSERSRLPDIVHSVMTDRDAWFAAPQSDEDGEDEDADSDKTADSVGNSSDGQTPSSA